jgi:hypothetical protein
MPPIKKPKNQEPTMCQLVVASFEAAMIIVCLMLGVLFVGWALNQIEDRQSGQSQLDEHLQFINEHGGG